MELTAVCGREAVPLGVVTLARRQEMGWKLAMKSVPAAQGISIQSRSIVIPSIRPKRYAVVISHSVPGVAAPNQPAVAQDRH